MTETIIIGDFNMNYMDEKHMRQCKFKNFLLELNMRQMINEGTRITKKSRTTIDLIITDCPYVNCVGTLNVNMSDHLPIYLIRKKVRKKVLKREVWGRSYRRYESNQFKRSIIEADWSEFDDTGDPEKLWEIMREIFEKPLDKFCPITKLMIPEKKPKWINADILKLMRDRDTFYHRARRTGDQDAWNIARYLQNEVNMAIKTFKAIKIKSDLDRYQNNPKKFWEKIHELLPKNNTTYRINSLLDEDTDAIITSGKLSGHVNEYFTQIGAKLAEVHQHEYNDLDEGDNMDRGYDNQDNITGKMIDLKEIIPVLININVTKSSAVRHMSSMVLKDAFLAVPDKLCKIYNCSLERQIFPKAWKTSMVIPVPKVSQPKYASQLRPISLLSLPGKILERIIGTRLNKYLEQNNILSPKQHGFRKGKSTTTSIVSLLTDVYNNINDSLPTYAIFFGSEKSL